MTTRKPYTAPIHDLSLPELLRNTFVAGWEARAAVARDKTVLPEAKDRLYYYLEYLKAMEKRS